MIVMYGKGFRCRLLVTAVKVFRSGRAISLPLNHAASARFFKYAWTRWGMGSMFSALLPVFFFYVTDIIECNNVFKHWWSLHEIKKNTECESLYFTMYVLSQFARTDWKRWILYITLHLKHTCKTFISLSLSFSLSLFSSLSHCLSLHSVKLELLFWVVNMC